MMHYPPSVSYRLGSPGFSIDHEYIYYNHEVNDFGDELQFFRKKIAINHIF